jgi:Rps23 Pro-64 3,4-dihydroxylase Tpa1-like proline 4-hydroxylase
MVKERDGVVVVPDFMSADTVALYTEEINMLPRHDREEHMCDKYVQMGESAVLSPLLDALRDSVKKFIEDYYSCSVGNEQIGSLVVACPGWDLELHADAHEDEDTKSVGTFSGYASRDISTVLYFNNHGSDFTGGEFSMPNQDLHILPKAGLLVAFPSGDKYMHQVTKVQSGERLLVSTFWHVLERFDSTRYV